MKVPVLITLPVTMLLLLSCRQHDEPPEALPTRTIIAYIVADNNLDPFAVKDLNEMEQGWSATLDGNLIAYVDRAEGASPAHPVVYKIEHELLDFLAFEPFYSGVNIIRKTLLNFTDTSKYSYYSATLPQDMSAEDYIFVRHHFSSGNASYTKNGADYSVLYFTDSIANIMQKDYTMLDKFKEYYAHE
jgi:hypothetical protein